MDHQEQESVRIDIWLWATRLFKTRNLSGAACKRHQVLVNGNRCRPARQVRVDDEIVVRRGLITKTVVVKAILEKRVGAKLVDDFLIDKTPPEEYERAAEAARFSRESGAPKRDRGSGRPTKRDRRDLDEAMGQIPEIEVSFEEFVKSFSKNR